MRGARSCPQGNRHGHVKEIVPGYVVKTRIGKGAGTLVYAARDLRTGETVAIKHLLRKSADDDRLLQQMETEYEVCTSLDHPQLRKVILLHRVKKLLQVKEAMLVMEYFDGLGLHQAPPTRLDLFLTVMRHVANGLSAMHKAGFIHSDIKPNNILIGRAGVKIIDFGQACRIGHKKERIQGTPDFIAPEQVKRRQLDQRTDVFNVGATMYWLLTRENYPTEIRGLDAPGKFDILHRDKPVAPIELNDKLPPALSKLVMDCCQAKPANRPQQMTQVAARLEIIQKHWRQEMQERKDRAKGKTNATADPMMPPKDSDAQSRADV